MTAINPHGTSLNHAILSVLVQNRPGVLARVASLFARRGYNIFSLAVAPAEDENMSRITIVVDLESAPLEQIVKQLFKLVDVVKISELDPRRSIERELLLATVRVTAEERTQLFESDDSVVRDAVSKKDDARQHLHVQLRHEEGQIRGVALYKLGVEVLPR